MPPGLCTHCSVFLEHAFISQFFHPPSWPVCPTSVHPCFPCSAKTLVKTLGVVNDLLPRHLLAHKDMKYPRHTSLREGPCLSCASGAEGGSTLGQGEEPEAVLAVEGLTACPSGGWGTALCPDFKGSVLLCASRSYSYMIDNVILLITGTLHQRSIAELVPKCHPLGSFEQMEAVNIAQTPAELYNAILVDTPLGERPWRRGERRAVASMSVPPGGVFWTLGAAWSQKVRPTHGCLPFSSCQIRLPFSSLRPAFCSLPAAFTRPGRLPPGPDSDDLTS